jgi:hypothetical protein
MRKLSQILALTFICFIGHNARCQNHDAIDSAFIKLNQLPPMEKIYVHTDKSMYASGSTIWLKPYLVSVTGHLLFEGSQFVYVELFDKSNRLIKRIKIKKNEGVFAGHIKLPQDLQEGEYLLKAYTTWMLNQGDDYLFRKTIKVQNVIRSNYNATIDWERKNDKNAIATVAFTNKDDLPANNEFIECTFLMKNRQTKTFERYTGGNGVIRLSIHPDTLKNISHIDVQVKKDDKKFRKRFELAGNQNEFDLQFFPEGGDLVQGQGTKVAFKAIGSDGLHRDVKGCLLNSENDTIQFFSSAHKGMGLFFIIPDTLSDIKALAWINEDSRKEFDLPKVQKTGAALSIVPRANDFKIAIKLPKNSLIKPSYLIAHSGENLLFKKKLDALVYSIPKNILPEGLINFVLLDDATQALSSRLVFNKVGKRERLQAFLNKEMYTSREAVEMSLMLDSLSEGGNFSIAVTDNSVVRHDSLANTIESCLLLTSDLKGYIEDPNFYFSDQCRSMHLDLLMLTQGWRRFDIKAIIDENIRLKHYLEIGQSISGSYTKGILHQPVSTEITALSTHPPIFKTCTSDDKGNFVFNGLDFKDSTSFTIQSQKYTTIRVEPAGTIKIDEDYFPERGEFWPFKANSIVIGQASEYENRMMYDGGIRHVLMEEFVVKGKNKTVISNEVKYGVYSTVMDANEIEKKFPIPLSLDKLVKRLGGTRVVDDNVYLSGCTGPAEILLDNMEVDVSVLSSIYSDELESVIKITGAAAAVYSRRGGGGGVLMIKTKIGHQDKREVLGIVTITPLGYQAASEFYVPKYEVDSIKKSHQYDLRSTIYWNPNIQIDSTGRADLKFFTADPEANYTYVIEGITVEGDICRKKGTIYR